MEYETIPDSTSEKPMVTNFTETSDNKIYALEKENETLNRYLDRMESALAKIENGKTEKMARK